MAPFAPFEARPVLAVAVSGGRDSLALALLAHDWARARGGRVVGADRRSWPARRNRRRGGDDARSAGAPRHRRRDPALVGRQAATRPAGGGARGALSAAARGLPPARHPASAARPSCRRPGRDGGHARRPRRAGPMGLPAWRPWSSSAKRGCCGRCSACPRARLTATLEARGVPGSTIRRTSTAASSGRGCARTAARRRPPSDRAGGGAAARDRAWPRRRWARSTFDAGGVVADRPCGFRGWAAKLQERLLSRVVQAVGRRDHPPRRERLERAAARLSQGAGRGKSGKSQDFTLSGCRLMLRQEPGSRRLRWIVRPENGRRNDKKPGQPLVPAAFFACGAPAAPHLD